MSDEDFTIGSLAEYLHLDAGQVARLVERGQIPGRRVGGEWRFSPAEIHHWLERRIGASDEAELLRMEGALDRAAGELEPAVSIAELLPVAAIGIPLGARTRNSVIHSMVELAARTGRLWDPGRMAEAVVSREEMHPTALENGVALLHPRRPMSSILEQPVLALGITAGGIPFGGSRGMLTDVFFLIASTDDRGHLRALARLSRLISDVEFLSELRTSPDAAAAHAVIEMHESRLSG